MFVGITKQVSKLCPENSNSLQVKFKDVTIFNPVGSLREQEGLSLYLVHFLKIKGYFTHFHNIKTH